MRYSETYDWRSQKFWTNFTLWIVGLLILQIAGWYLKSNFEDWKYYLGWIFITLSIILIISNLMTASNRAMWLKNKNNPDYLAKFDENDIQNIENKKKIEKIFNDALHKSIEEKLKNKNLKN